MCYEVPIFAQMRSVIKIARVLSVLQFFPYSFVNHLFRLMLGDCCHCDDLGESLWSHGVWTCSKNICRDNCYLIHWKAYLSTHVGCWIPDLRSCPLLLLVKGLASISLKPEVVHSWVSSWQHCCSYVVFRDDCSNSNSPLLSWHFKVQLHCSQTSFLWWSVY